MKSLNEFLTWLLTEEERLGLKNSGIIESIEKMDSSDTTRYDVVMIPRRPPRSPRPQGSPATPKPEGPDPGRASDYFNRGWTAYQLGQYERAIQDYDEVIRLYYQGAAAYTAIGKSIEAKRDFAKAEELGIEEKEPQSSRLGNVLGFAVRP